MEIIAKPGRKKWFTFTIYNHIKDEGRFIVHWNWHVKHIPFEGVEYSRTPKLHQLLFAGKDNIYWLFSKNSEGKYKWFRKTTNDHCSCG